MNERIRELADQCQIEEYNQFGDLVEFGFDAEKFAELLVLECVTAVMDGTKEGDHYAMRIEKHFDNGPGGILHFGVEE